MKIGNFDPKALGALPAADRKAPTADKPGTAAGPGPSARVDLSSTQAMRSAVGTEPSFDQAKVDLISQQIRDGSFRVNAGAIADKLIGNAQDLLSGPKA